MIRTRRQWIESTIHIRKAHEDAIRLTVLSAHDGEPFSVDGYERLALANLKSAADALGFTLEEKKK